MESEMEEARLDFRILGPLGVLVDGRDVTPARPKQRALLALLVLRANEILSSDELIDALWGDRPPATAQAALRGHVSSLRKIFGQDTIATRPPGYVLRVGPEQTDLERFQRLLDEAGRESAPSERARLLRSALALFRGDPLADFRYADFVRTEAERLEELRLTALEERVGAELELGRHGDLIAELRRLVAENPLRERLWEQLMLALYRAGRQADALRAYQDARRVLTEQLGLDPGPALQELERKMLAQDPELMPLTPAAATPPGPAPKEADQPAGPGREEPDRAEVPRRERKVVTILFCDLVGFTTRAQRMDPEDVAAELSHYQAWVRRELERYGGTVEKFIGDAVMAVFGAPVAHEDDPERAVRAALATVDWARDEQIEVRIGVNTGEALVTLPVRTDAGETLAAGDVVNVAARLQTAAPVNGILVGEATHGATLDLVAYAESDPIAAKGRSEPVPAWQATEVRGKPRVARVHTTALVGRAGELQLLNGALARSRGERSVQLVTLIGVPGIGKSRLVFELHRLVDADPELVTWREGRCLPYGDGVTFWALGEIVKSEAGILENDAPDTVERKLLDAAKDERLAAHLRPLVGLGAAELGGDRGEAFAAWREYFERLADRHPLVLVLEDLHWADDNLLDFLDHLAEWARAVPILLVCTARPELLDRRPSWGGGKQNSVTVSLSPLSEGETSRLLVSLVDQSAVDDRAWSNLVSRVGGNPLFAEQYARTLHERGDPGELPDTIQGTISARLDLLEPRHKALVQDAAVLGRVFWLDGLARVSGAEPEDIRQGLHALERMDLVRRERESSIAGDTQYAFAHVVLRDVAYGQLPRADRAQSHRRAAGWLESLGPSQDRVEMLAHHYLSALEFGRASRQDVTELVARARLALREAGDHAAALYAVDTAQRFYDAALELWPDDDPERVDLLYRRAVPVGHHVGGGDPERLAEARDALMAAGAPDRAAELEALLMLVRRMEGDHAQAEKHRDRARGLLGDGAPSRSRAWVLSHLASEAFVMGEDEDRAAELTAEACRVARAAGADDALSVSLCNRGLLRITGGDAEGITDVERALDLASSSGTLGSIAGVNNNMAVAYQVVGDLERGFQARLEGARAAQQLGSDSQVRWFDGVLTEHRYSRGEWDLAERGADAFLEQIAAGEPHILGWQVHSVRAAIRVARGEIAGALHDTERALAEGRRAGEVQSVAYVLAAAAHIFALASEEERARVVVHEFVDTLRQGPHIEFAVIKLPVATIAASRLGLASELISAIAGYPRSRWTEAARAYLNGDFLTAADTVAAAGAKPEEAEARARAAEVLAREGRRPEAEAQLEAALAFYRSVGATRYLQELPALDAPGSEPLR
jgi:DNA-binding SARP family transcriptional activator/class 3 adenylate cyclase